MCERMVTYYFLSSPHFVLKRSFSTASLKVRGDYRERQGFNFVEKRDENSLPWTNSYRLWKWYRPEQDATEVENVYNDGMYRHNNKVIQREQKTQNWWSSTNGNEQYTTLKDGRYVSGPTREASRHLNFRNQSHSNNMTRIDDSLNVRRRGKLLDPQQEFGSVRAKLNHILFDEYIGGECSLSTILDWADQMRSSKVEETPLLNLIGRLQMVGQHSLIPPLYNAFIKSSEAKPYANRPEILLPAIANAFQSANPIKEVHLLFSQINALLQRNKQQEYLYLLQFFTQLKFKYFIYRVGKSVKNGELNKDFCALQIEEMASFLRNCWPCPLADSIDFVFRWKLGDKLALELYQAFLREPAERNLYADRYHIFFPWMIEVIDDKKNRGRNEWVAVLVKLIELDLNKLLPNFMRGKLHSEIGNLFNYACKNRNFDVAEKVWDYCKITGLSHRFSVNSLFLFTLYHWTNGRRMTAKTIASVLQSRIRFLRDVSNNKFSEDKTMEEMKDWKNIRDRFLEINRSYKDIMENPQTKERTRKVCSRVLNGFVNDFIDDKSRK